MSSIYQAGNVASSQASFQLDGNGRLALVIDGQVIDLYGSFYSQVQFSDGVVTLSGPAPDEKSRDRAAVLAAAPDGVRQVDNRLVVLAAVSRL